MSMGISQHFERMVVLGVYYSVERLIAAPFHPTSFYQAWIYSVTKFGNNYEIIFRNHCTVGVICFEFDEMGHTFLVGSFNALNAPKTAVISCCFATWWEDADFIATPYRASC